MDTSLAFTLFQTYNIKKKYILLTNQNTSCSFSTIENRIYLSAS